MRIASGRSTCSSARCQPPTPIADTFSPVRPSTRYGISDAIAHPLSSVDWLLRRCHEENEKRKAKNENRHACHACGAAGLRDSGAFFVFRLRFSLLAAQDPPAPRPFTTEVNYVRVDMYPTSGDKPVTDLQQNDVELLEDGVPQKIVQFEHVSVGSPRPQTLRPEPSTMAEMRRAIADPRARVVVLFLDPRFVAPEGSMRIRRPLIDALNRLIGGDDLIAVMTPDMSAQGITFTRRTGSIEQMLSGLWGTKGWLGTRDPLEVQYESCYDRPSIVDGPWMARGDDRAAPRDADARRARRAHSASARRA